MPNEQEKPELEEAWVVHGEFDVVKALVIARHGGKTIYHANGYIYNTESSDVSADESQACIAAAKRAFDAGMRYLEKAKLLHERSTKVAVH